jgi:DNA mismatch repair protein MutS
MVEMRETAQILAQASARSLVLLDEVGRGTATYDGLSLAWAITEYLHDQVGCRALFATHYHELCGLEATLAGLANAHVTVDEVQGDLRFLHRLAPGPAARSYGIAVGRLAGLPGRVLRRAERILADLDARGDGRASQLDLFRGVPSPADTVAVAPDDDGVRGELCRLDLDGLSPREAHELLRALQARARG